MISALTIILEKPSLGEFTNAVSADGHYQELITAIANGKSNPSYTLDDSKSIILQNNKILVPYNKALRHQLLKIHYDSILADHPGVKKTEQLIHRQFTFTGLSAYVRSYVESCNRYMRTKTWKAKPYRFLQSLPIPETPWTSISMDYIEQLPELGGYDAVLVVVDRLTKMAHFLPSTTTVTALQLAQLYITNIFKLHGTPMDIVSDRGSEFVSKFWQEFTARLNIKSKLSTAYHPRTDGQTERVNQVLKQYIQIYTNYQQNDWLELLPLAKFAYNNAEHSSIGVSPFVANYGYTPSWNISIVDNSDIQSPGAFRLSTRLKLTRDRIKTALQELQLAQAKYFNKNRSQPSTFQVGDKVLLSSKNLRVIRPSKALSDKFIGPFEITDCVGDRAYRLKLPKDYQIHPVFYVELLRPYKESPLRDNTPKDSPPPAPVRLNNGEEVFLVEEILDDKLVNDKLWYLVSFKGYPAKRNEWIPTEDLLDSAQLIEAYKSDKAKATPVQTPLSEPSLRTLPRSSRAPQRMLRPRRNKDI